MLQIKLVNELKIVENLCAIHGIEFCGAIFAYEMTGSNSKGYCLFSHDADTAQILAFDVQPYTFPDAEALIRSVLFFLYKQGVVEIGCKCGIFKKMGYVDKDDACIDPENFFNSPCGGS